MFKKSSGRAPVLAAGQGAGRPGSAVTAARGKLSSKSNFRSDAQSAIPWRQGSRTRSLSRRCLYLFPLLAAAGCQSLVPPIPPADLKEPGWTVREGQAVWRLPDSTELAGEVLVATRPDGRAFVQFTKTPFPMFVGQELGNRWEVQLPAKHKRYAGYGQPPERLLWLYLPRVLSGKPPPPKWVWREDARGWRLENPGNREAVEGYFNAPPRASP